jgi:hypothetical protein
MAGMVEAEPVDEETASTDPRLDPITLLNGDIAYPSYMRVLTHDNERITNVEFINQCYDVDNPKEMQVIAFDSLPGTGKSTIIEAALHHLYAARGADMQKDCMVTCSVGTTEWDIIGQPWENPATGKVEFQPGPLHFCMTNGLPLFIEEWAQARPGIWGKLLPALDARGVLNLPKEWGGTIHAAPGFGVILAANYQVKGATFFEPLADRADHIIPFYTNWDLVRRLLGPEYRQIVTALQAMDQARQQRLMSWSPQFRTVMQAAKSNRKFGKQVMLSSLMNKFRLASDRDEAMRIINDIVGITHIPELSM